MQLDISVFDPTWLKLKAALDEKRASLITQIISRGASDEQRAEFAAQIRLIDLVLQAPAVGAYRAAQGT